MHPNGVKTAAQPDWLGAFLNAVQSPAETAANWQRRGVKFTIKLVNVMDPSKSIVKGAALWVSSLTSTILFMQPGEYMQYQKSLSSS